MSAFYGSDKIYWLGYNAFLTNLHWPPSKIERNFYLTREWHRGYNRAYFDNQKGKALTKHEAQEKIAKARV